MNNDNQKTFANTTLSPQRLAKAKAAYTTRRVDHAAIKTLLSGDQKPKPGDLVLARVEAIGHHRRIELVTGRRAPLFVGDEIIVSYGHRYAPDQFESEVPEDLSSCHLVAGGGIASLCFNRHDRTKMPTSIQPLGLLGDAEGNPINMMDWSITPTQMQLTRPFVVTVVGTAMNAGKTTTAAHLIRGLAASGMKVGAAKITGTGAGGDRWLMVDAGATEVVDFTDAGFASTYLTTLAELEHIQQQLIMHLCNKKAEVIVLEVADGLFQRETEMLLESPVFKANVDAIVFAAGDAMGACGGTDWLRKRDLPLIALSGCLSASPLATREAKQSTGLPVLGLEQLSSPDVTLQLFEYYGDQAAMAS